MRGGCRGVGFIGGRRGGWGSEGWLEKIEDDGTSACEFGAVAEFLGEHTLRKYESILYGHRIWSYQRAQVIWSNEGMRIRIGKKLYQYFCK